MFYLDLLKHFVDAKYYDGLRVIPLVMLGELFFGIYFNLSIWYKLTDRTQWGAYFSVAGCTLTIAIIVLFVPSYGFMACAWASFASNLLMMLLSYAVGQKYYPVAYDLRSAFTYGAVAAVCYMAAMLPPIDSVVLRLLYRTVWLLFFTGIVVRKDLPITEIPYLSRYFGHIKKIK